MRRILVTGATGKIGTRVIQRITQEPAFADVTVRALCHERLLAGGPRVEAVRGSVVDRHVVRKAMAGVSHVVHLAAGRGSPDAIIDVAVKGTLWLLEECSLSTDFRQFILLAAELGMGPQDGVNAVGTAEGVCEDLPNILPATILEQFQARHDLNGCCLRSAWVVEKDDLSQHLSFGEEKSNRPFWRKFVGPAESADLAKKGAVPVLLDADGHLLKQNIVHVDDLVDAIFKVIDHPSARQETFRICMDEPFDYAELARHLKQKRGLPSVEVKTPLRSRWIDNAKARILLGWRPKYNLDRIVEEAFDAKR
jgi:UDP-glucose 4-epimerase